MKAVARLAAARRAAIGIAVALAAAAALATLPTTQALAAHPAKPTAKTPITRSAHIAFENCNAQHITLTVTAPSHAFTPAQPVIVKVQLRNTGSTPCGDSPAGSVPEAHHALAVGPCGPLSLTVHNALGVAVYPGPVVYHCPEETGFQLAPHSTAQATASWNQAAAPVSSASQVKAPPLEQAPVGTYRITIGGAVTVPITLATPSS
jgi:hypothetical protein